MTDGGTIWDEMAKSDGGSVKLTNEGDVFEGVLAEVKLTQFETGNAVTLVLDDGRFHHASTVDAKRKLSELKPAPGDAVRIKLVALVPNKHGGKSKVHDISVVRAAESTVAPF